MTNIHAGSGQAMFADFQLKFTKNTATLQSKKIYQPSEAGMRALAAIGGSTKLSTEQKRTLTRLIAMVDEYAGGNPKMMRAIIGIAGVMAMHAKKSYPPTPLQEMLKMYQEERERLSLNGKLSGTQVTTEITILAQSLPNSEINDTTTTSQSVSLNV